MPLGTGMKPLLRAACFMTTSQLGLSPEEISTEVPHLSLAQVYAALTYYHANRDEIEADVAAEDAEAKQLEAQQALPRNAT